MKIAAIPANFDIYNDLNDIIYIIDKDFNIVYGNEKFKSFYEISGPMAKNKTNDEIFNVPDLKNRILKYIKSGDTSNKIELSKEIHGIKSKLSLKKIDNKSAALYLIIEKPEINENSLDFVETATYDFFINNMDETLALFKVMPSSETSLTDFEFIKVNKAFEKTIGYKNDQLKGKLLRRKFPKLESHWIDAYIKAYEQQETVTLTAFLKATNKYWELRVYPAGKDKVASLANDVTDYIVYENNIKEKNEQISLSEEKLRAYNEHLRYTCELIKESELSYKTLFEQNNDAIMILVDGIVKDCNNKTLQLLNCQPYDLIGKPFAELSSLENESEVDAMEKIRNYCESINQNEKYTLDWQLKRPDGIVVETNIIISCYMLENIKHMYLIIKDLTKEKTFIEEIKENEYLLEEAQKTAKLGYWSFDMLKGMAMDWSPEMKSIIEYNEPTGFFEFLKTIIHPDDDSKIASEFDYYTIIPSHFDLQFRIKTGTQKTKFVHFIGKTIVQRNKQICRGIIQDITSKYEQEERIIFESKINETIAKAGTGLISPSLSVDNIVRTIFKACVELTHSETGFVAYDDPLSDKILIHYYEDDYINGKKVSNNISFIQRKKYVKEGLYGHPLELSTYKVDNNFDEPVIDNLGKSSLAHIYNYLTFPSVINDNFTGQIVLVNSPNGFTDQHIEAIKTLSNIYGLAIFRKQMEWDLVAAKEKAEESDRLKSAFLANMSHEIRTPMNAIVGFSQLLIHTELSQEKKTEFGQLINNSCEDLLTIVNDIIDISKIEAGQLLIKPKTINLYHVLDEIYALAVNKANLKERLYPIYLDRTVDENLEWVVDVVRFKQVFLNLIDNAIKFTEHGSVTIGCKINNLSSVSFYVKDTGIGIPQHEITSVFESFRQVETTIDRTYGGTGLGLAISKSLIRQMGGSIHVESKENVGSKFWFELPLRLPLNTDPKLSGITEIQSEINLADKKILIIEDEVRNAKLLKFFLDETGADISFAFDGKEAINKAKKAPPDLVLLDIKMPNMDGITVLNVLKELYPDLPVIAQTAYAMANDEKIIIEKGCDAYISKPVQKEHLLKAIRKVLKLK